RTLSAEGLLSLQPDMVIGNEHMGPTPVLRALAAAGIAVLRLPSAQDADGLRQNIHTLTARLDKPAVGAPLLATLDRHLEALASRPLAGLRCAFLLSVDSGRLRLAGQHTAGDAL